MLILILYLLSKQTDHILAKFGIGLCIPFHLWDALNKDHMNYIEPKPSCSPPWTQFGHCPLSEGIPRILGPGKPGCNSGFGLRLILYQTWAKLVCVCAMTVILNAKCCPNTRIGKTKALLWIGSLRLYGIWLTMGRESCLKMKFDPRGVICQSGSSAKVLLIGHSRPLKSFHITGDIRQDHHGQPKLEQAVCTNLHPLPMGHKLHLHSPPSLL